MSVAMPADEKGKLRRAMMERRRETHRVSSQEAALSVKVQVLAAVAPQGKTIAGYWPLGDELDCRPALDGLCGAGATIALPVVAGQGQVLIFRQWRLGEALDQGPFGTLHPTPRAAVVRPDILLVPLLAFDRTGHRLGYGAGYYDRTIAALRADGGALQTLGIAYAAQEVPVVPVDTHDQRLHGIITETGTLWF